MAERAEQVASIEKSIAEIHGMFRRLADVTRTAGDDEKEEEEVAMSVTDAWINAKLFGILLLFIFVFVLFFL